MKVVWHLLCLIYSVNAVITMEKPSTHNTLPSVKAMLTVKGLNFIKDTGLKLAVKRVSTISLPDVSGKSSTPVGSVKYYLTQMKINHFTLGTSAIKTQPPKTLRLTLRNAYLQITGNWRYKYLFIRDSGTFTGKANGISVNLGINVGKDLAGKPTVVTQSCGANINDISVKVNGGASWLYNLILDAFKGDLKKTMQKQICPAISNAINKQAETALQKLKVNVPIYANMLLDVSLVQPPTMTSQTIEFALQGRCFPKDNKHIKFPFSPTILPEPPRKEQMMFAAIGEYTFQTFGYSLWSSKLLDIWITKDMLPKKYKNITADILAFFIMGFKKFKGRPLEFRINATNPPSLSFGDKVMNVGLELDVMTYVVLANKTKFLAMNLHVVSKASGNITVNDVKATAHVSSLTAHFSLKSSAVGFIPISVMNYFIPGLIRSSVLPTLNEKLLKGYLLPTYQGISIVSPKLQIAKRALTGSCDWKFSG